MQVACGSLTNLLKIRAGLGGDADGSGNEAEPIAGTASGQASMSSGGGAANMQQKTSGAN